MRVDAEWLMREGGDMAGRGGCEDGEASAGVDGLKEGGQVLAEPQLAHRQVLVAAKSTSVMELARKAEERKGSKPYRKNRVCRGDYPQLPAG